MNRLMLILVLSLFGSEAHAIKAQGPIQYLPKDGGPPITLNPATQFMQLAGRYSPLIGIATAAVQACVETHCFNMITGQNAQPPAVPGWADPSTPPGTTATTTRYVSNNGAAYDTPSEACTASQHDANWTDPFLESSGLSSYGACDIHSATDPNVTFGGAGGSWYVPGTNTGCPTGYQLVSGVCQLIPAQAGSVKWPSDGAPTFMLDENNNWKPHPQDPDKINPATGQPYQTPDPFQSLFDQDEHGNPTDTKVTPQPDGGTKTTQKTEGQNPQTGTTDTTTHETTTNSQGTVINYTYQYHQNTTISNTTQNQALPTDYARENTLAGTKAKLQEILDQMKKPPEPPGPVNQNEPGPENENIILPTISTDGQEFGNECPSNITFTALGSTFTISLTPMCQGASFIAPLIVGFAWLLAARIVAGGLPLG